MEANLKRGNPRNLRIAAAFEFESNQEALAAEKRAHQHFAGHKHQKEWFAVGWQEIAAWIQESGAKVRSDAP